VVENIKIKTLFVFKNYRYISVNQSIVYLLTTHQAMKQYEPQEETSRTTRHQSTYSCPYDTKSFQKQLQNEYKYQKRKQ